MSDLEPISAQAKAAVEALLRPDPLDLARANPDLFDICDGQVYVRADAEGKPCPCCGLPLANSPLPRVPG